MQESALDMTVPFESASELKEAHTSLLEAHDRQIGPDASADNAAAALRQLETQIRHFLERGAAAGIYIEEITDRTSCQVLLDYWVSSLSHAGLEVTGMRLARFDGSRLPDLKDKPCPYVGLEAFRNQDFFFGREADIQQLLRQVHESPLVVVLGASGSGKSSLVMGGVLPALTGSEKEPEFVVVPPFVPGNAVLDGLAKAVLQLRSGGSDHVTEETRLRHTPLHLSTMVGCKSAPPTLITIDQFEEVFTLSTPADREALVSNLGQLLQAGRGHRVILTVREEFRSRIVELLTLSPYLDKAWYSMRPMSYEELKAAVEKPAALVNLQFQSGIVDDLVKKVLGQPAALPLLQFTLRMLWEKRDRNRITNEVYRKVGDPLNALMANADAFYDRLAPQTQNEVKRILLELVRVDELLEAYRQPVLQSRLVQAGKANTEEVITLLATNDYVRITPSGGGTDAVIEVKHESLIRNWPRFVAWIDEKRVQRRQRLALTQAAERWAQKGKPPEGLLTGWQLQEAKGESELLEIEQEFIQTSSGAADHLQHQKAEEQAHAIRVKIIARSFAVIALLSLAVGFYMWRARDVAQTAQGQAKAAQKEAEEAKTRAEDLLGFLLGERFLGKIRDVGNSSMLEQIQDKVRSYESDHEPNLALVRGLALRNAADIQRMHGSTQRALPLFNQALEAIKSGPHPDGDRETARTYDRLGDVLAAQGEISKALAHYKEAVQSWRRVIASTTVKVPDCIGLADSLVSAGDLEQRMGKTADAVKNLTEALVTVTTIPLGRCAHLANATESYPSPEALVVLSRALLLRASIFDLSEDYEGAVRLAGEAKRLRPTSVSAKTQEATALASLANSKSLEDPQNILQSYRPILAEFDLLLHHDPTNRLWKREQAAVQLLIAEAAVACHRAKVNNCQARSSLTEAELTNLKALATLRALAKDDPSNISLQRDLGWAMHGRAQIFDARQDHHARLAAYRTVEQLYGGSIRDPSDAEGALSRGRILLDQSKALADLAKWPEAKATLQDSIAMYETYEKQILTQKDKFSLLAYLIEARTEETKLLRKAGDKKGANQAEREQERLQKIYDDLYYTLLEIKKKDADTLFDSKTASMEQGRELFKKGDHAAALLEFKAAEIAMREYISFKPVDYRGYDSLRYVYGWIRSTQEKLGHAKEARETIRLMVDMARIAFLLSSQKDASSSNEKLREAQQGRGIALYNSPDFKDHVDETLATVQEEIVSAEEPLRINPNNASSLKNLGNAYYGQSLVSREAQKDGWEEAIRIGIVSLQRAATIDEKTPQYHKELAGMHKYLADTLDADGEKEKALPEYGLALKAYKQAARLSPEDKEIKDAIQDLKAIGFR